MALLRKSPSGPLVRLGIGPISGQHMVGNPDLVESLPPVAITTSQALDFLTKAFLGFLFDGTANANVQFGNVLNKTRLSPFTIIAWYRTRIPGANFGLVNKQGGLPAQLGYSFGVRGVGYFFRFAVDIGGATNGISVNNETVIHDTELTQCAVTYDGSGNASGVRIIHQLTVVPNTVLQNNLSTNPTNAFSLAIGARPIDGSSGPNGQVLQVSMWNRALTLAEIGETNDDGVPASDLRATSMASALEWWIQLMPATDSLPPGQFVDLSNNHFDGTADSGVTLDNIFDSLIVRRDEGWVLEHVDEVVFPSLGRAEDMPKVFMCVNVTSGTPALVTGYNVASISDDGAGQLGVVFGTAFTSSTYCALASVNASSTTITRSVTTTNQSATGLRIISVIEGGSGNDPVNYTLVCFGGLVGDV